MTTLVETPRIILATVTSDGAAVAGRHTPVDATAGNRTMTLPTSATPGAHLSVEKVDASSNTVTVTGKIRGTTSTLPLSLRYQSVTFVADQTGTSWTPTAGHITAASLSATSATLWKANTAYVAGQAVVNPSGFVVTALTGFTSGSSYSASNWSDPVANSYAPIASTRPKQSVRVAATANVTLTAPGATIDGVTLTSGDRVLLTGQSTASQNGIYVFNGSASTMTRATDANTSALLLGAFVFVSAGATQAQSGWELTNTTLVVDTDSQNWVQFDAQAVPTAKGDLVVGTGAGANARHAVGTDGFVFTADSTQADGVKWASPAPTPYPTITATGNYYFVGSAGSTGTNALSVNSPRVTPWIIDKTTVIARIGVEFTVAGDASSVIRLGIWADSGAGRPYGALIVDAGTISTGTGNAGNVATGGTPGVYEIVLATPVTLPPGLYWFGGVVQGVTTTSPTIRIVGTTGYEAVAAKIPLGGSIPSSNLIVAGVACASQSGALGVLSGASVSSQVPRIFYKTS